MGSQVSEMERALGAIAEDVERFRATLDGIREAARRDANASRGDGSGGEGSRRPTDLDANLKMQHGSKPIALLRYLQQVGPCQSCSPRLPSSQFSGGVAAALPPHIL